MNKKELARFRELILAERDRVASKLGLRDRRDDRGKETSQSTYSNHMADAGSDAMEQEQVFQRASQGSDYLAELDLALKRIDAGIYGTCEECGNAIPVKRLEAYLAASLCVECKSRLEKLRN